MVLVLIALSNRLRSDQTCANVDNPRGDERTARQLPLISEVGKPTDDSKFLHICATDILTEPVKKTHRNKQNLPAF